MYITKEQGRQQRRHTNVLKTYDAASTNQFIYSKHLFWGHSGKISLRPVPAQAKLWLIVNNNKTLLLVVFTIVLEEFDCP